MRRIDFNINAETIFFKYLFLGSSLYWKFL